MKKILALVLALCMVLTIGAAFADGDQNDATTPALPTATISITALEEGDVVSLYKIIKWETAATADTPDWVFDGITVSGYSTVDSLITALGGGNAPTAMTALVNAVTAANKATVIPAYTVGSDKTFSYDAAEVGSYLALVTTSTDNIYNPMVLSVSFDHSDAVDSTLAATSPTGTSIVAKKQHITLDKEVNDPDKKQDLYAGETIPFKVETTTPNYGTNYTQPHFVLTDTLSQGLTMSEDQQGKIAVKVGGENLEKGEDKDYTIETTASGYIITFTEQYLHEMKADVNVVITYEATVTQNANFHQVEEYVNEVTLEYSNNPSGDYGSLTDDTHHYTFSIDAMLYGQSSGDNITKELKKIGEDVNGNPIVAWETSEPTNWTKYEALEGAHFELRKGNDVIQAKDSGPDGRLNFTGLDVGNYMLYETSAPFGYKFSKEGIPVSISASYDNDGILTEYTITINNTNTSTYTVATNEQDHISTVTIKENTDPTTTGVVNTPAATLPSTGGIGTTIFYILGGLLVVGAVVILVARRKAQD